MMSIQDYRTNLRATGFATSPHGAVESNSQCSILVLNNAQMRGDYMIGQSENGPSLR